VVAKLRPGDIAESASASGQYEPAEEREVQLVRVDSLVLAELPRLARICREHVARLVESVVALPPIAAQRQTTRVIDGMHQLEMAGARARDDGANLLRGGEDEDLVLSVELKVMHNLPCCWPGASQRLAHLGGRHNAVGPRHRCEDRVIQQDGGGGPGPFAQRRSLSRTGESAVTGTHPR
jgi:hypothetical protein